MASGLGAMGIDFQRLVGGSYVTVGEVRDIGGPNMTRAAIDNTHSASPGYWREFIGGLRDGGEIGVQVALVPATGTAQPYKRATNEFAADTLGSYKIVWPNSVELSFEGLLTGMSHAQNPLADEVMTLDLTFKISGQPTLA